MKVRWKINMQGMVGRQVVNGRGAVTEVSDEEGARYCKLGYCEPVAQAADDDVEKAVPEATEETREKSAEEPTAEKPKRRSTKSRAADGDG